MIKILSVFGTRPEAIKMAPLVKMLEKETMIESKVAVTGQHREMLDQVMSAFNIVPDYDLNIMRHGQTLTDIVTAAISGVSQILQKEKFDLVLVHGDTTTTLAGSLAAFYNGVPCGHVEAGLRTDDKYSPYPEEVNRRLTSVLADYHFAPTVTAEQNLLKEGVQPTNIAVTGNTVIDALFHVVNMPFSFDGLGLDNVDWQKKIILLTCHRRENWGLPMENIFNGLKDALEKRQDVEVVFPVHKNPLVRDTANKIFQGMSNVHLIEPLEYIPFCHLMNKSYFVLTDSGGIQEEAPSLGKPVLVLREVTERPEAVAAGTAKIAGNTRKGVKDAVAVILDHEDEYKQMSKASNPYGDGQAAARIVHNIKRIFNLL